MAGKYNERYVRYYTFGSAAAKLEDQQRRAALPKYKAPQKRSPIAVDPVAFVGCVVAVVLAVLMVVGFIQVAVTQARVHELQTQVAILEQEQKMLQERYDSGYDLDEVRIAAQSMGMVEPEEVTHIRVNVPEQIEQNRQMSWWDSFVLSLRQFFA